MATEYRPIPRLAVGVYPLTNVTPFTYRDGVTYEKLLHQLIARMNTIIGEVNTNNQALFDVVIENMNITIDAVNAALGEQTDEVNQGVADMVEYVDNAVLSIINSTIDVSDPVVSSLVNNRETASYESVSDVVKQKMVTVNFVDDYGADSSGSADCSTNWATMVNEIPDGSTIIVPPGTFLFTGTATNAGKSLHIDFTTAVIIQDMSLGGANTLFQFDGEWEEVYQVESLTVHDAVSGDRGYTTITPATPITYDVGDVVKVFSDNYAEASRPNTSRAGFFGSVLTPSLRISGKPIDVMDTNIRVSRLKKVTVTTVGGLFRKKSITPAQHGHIMLFNNLHSPRADRPVIEASSGIGIHFRSCYEPRMTDPTIERLRDTWDDTGVVGYSLAYGIHDTNSYGLLVTGYAGSGMRHATSTGQTSPDAGMTSDSDPALFGVSQDAKYVDSSAKSCYVSGFDTHASSYNVQFINCESEDNGYAGFGLRGRNNRVIGGRVERSFRGVIIFNENSGSDSYGHIVDSLAVDECSAEAVFVQVNTDTHPNVGVKSDKLNVTVNNLLVNGGTYAVRGVNAKIRVGDVTMNATKAARGALIGAENSDVDTGNLVAHSSVSQFSGVDILGENCRINVNAELHGTAGHRPIRGEGVTDAVVTGSIFSTVSLANPATIAPESAVSIKNTVSLFSQSYAEGTATAVYDRLGSSIDPVLTLVAERTIPASISSLKPGRFGGQMLNIVNPHTSTSTLTVVDGANTSMKDGDVILNPGETVTLTYSIALSAWLEI